MGTKYTAANKQNFLSNKINNQSRFGLPYEEKKLIAEFILEMLTTRKTANELLRVFEDAEMIIRKDGKIYSRIFFNDDLTFKDMDEKTKKIRTDLFCDDKEICEEKTEDSLNKLIKEAEDKLNKIENETDICSS